MQKGPAQNQANGSKLIGSQLLDVKPSKLLCSLWLGALLLLEWWCTRVMFRGRGKIIVVSNTLLGSYGNAIVVTVTDVRVHHRSYWNIKIYSLYLSTCTSLIAIPEDRPTLIEQAISPERFDILIWNQHYVMTQWMGFLVKFEWRQTIRQ